MSISKDYFRYFRYCTIKFYTDYLIKFVSISHSFQTLFIIFKSKNKITDTLK